MSFSLKSRFVGVWLFLVIATLLGWALGRGALGPLASYAGQSLFTEAAAAIVLAIAFIKVRLVVMEFMELRLAPWPFRLAFDVWCLALWSALAAMPALIGA